MRPENRFIVSIIIPEFSGRPGPGDMTMLFRRKPLDFLERDGIIPKNLQAVAHRTQILHQVKGERIIVVDDEYHIPHSIYD
jgi:hypothetical protein